MDLDALKTFITVVELKSFTKTAKALNLSQPTVSFHVKQIEEHFQTNLIDRTPKRFQMTETGELIYHRAKQMEKVMEKAIEEVYEHENQMRGSIRIGASYTVGEYVIPVLLKKFDSLYPAVDIEVRIDNTREINEALHLHDLDVGLVEGQVIHKDLTSVPFLEDKMVLLVPEAHQLWEIKNVSYKHLQNQIWISRERGSGSRAVMDAMLESSNLRPKKNITIGSNHGVVQAVKAGLGLSLVSETVVDHTYASNLVMAVPVIQPPARLFSLVLPSDSKNITKNVEVFAAMIQQMYPL
ncbi:LysR family transcriptional regulator [Halobacillus salinarum]|uniref:LysR family transcriptional regulator n=1 Tax=Halobacillus salinarum TaxID=2932257 RepID=A0ABY4EJ45_9BACI|nr:LysR family transcriptional regulator [Halobacillus salinarum]UOQ44460.1 LysR family transcriptional regulator [Halobacillus salinarum]